MEKEKLPLYEGTPTMTVGGRVPVAIKIKLMELAMKYKLSQGEYISYLVNKVTSDPDLFDPMQLDQLKISMAEAKAELSRIKADIAVYQEANDSLTETSTTWNREYDKLKTEFESVRATVSKATENAKAWQSKSERLEAKIKELEARIKQEEKEKIDLENHLLGKQKNTFEDGRKMAAKLTSELNQCKSKVDVLEDRIAKANARLKKEDITDGSFLGKQTPVQF